MKFKIKALKKSPWAFHLSTGSCNNCDIELLDCFTPRFDVERFGIIKAPSIRQADAIVITGSMNKKSAKRLKQLYKQAPKPCLVIALGECSCSRGIFKTSYNCTENVDDAVPVDVYVPGCPPRPEAIISGIVKALEKLK